MLGVRWAHSHPHRHQRRHQRLHQLQTRRRYHGCAPQRLLLHQRRREHLRGCGGVSAPRLAPVVGSEGTWLPVCLPSVANVVPPGAVRCKKRPRNSEPRHHQPRTGACQPCQPCTCGSRTNCSGKRVPGKPFFKRCRSIIIESSPQIGVVADTDVAAWQTSHDEFGRLGVHTSTFCAVLPRPPTL